MARYEIVEINGKQYCWDNELDISVGNADTCLRYQKHNINRFNDSKNPSKPVQYVAQSRFVGFLGMDENNIKRNLIYLGTSALGGYVGMRFIKLQSKAISTVAGIGLGLITGIILNKTLNK